MRKDISIVTHGANFHLDDLFGVATVLMAGKIANEKIKKTVTDKQKYRVIRTLDPDVIEKGDIVLDIGGIDDPKKNRFDHHQEGGAGKRANGLPYASFGLVWKKFGKKIAGSQELADYVDETLIAALDAADNGVDTTKDIYEKAPTYTIEDYIKDECILEKNKPTEKQNYDKMFMKLLLFAEHVIELKIEKGRSYIKAKKMVAGIYAKLKNKKIFILEKFVPFDFDDFPEVLFYIYKDLRGNWSAKAVRKERGSTASRMLFPESWRGKRDDDLVETTGISDAIFCHNSGFLAVAKSKAGALKMAEKTITTKITKITK